VTVTERVAPNVGTMTECFPGPPATMTMMSSGVSAIATSSSGDRSRQVLGAETAEPDARALPQRALEVGLRPTGGGDGCRMLGAENHERLAGEIDVVASGDRRRSRQRGEQPLGRRRPVVVDVVRSLGGAHRHAALVRPEAALDVKRLPRRGGLVLGEAIAVFSGMTEGGAIDVARRRARDVLQHEPQGPTDDGVGAMPLTERVRAGVDPQTPGDGAIDDDERRTGVRRRQHAFQVERRIRRGFHRRDDDGEMLWARTGQRGVDGDGLHRGQAEARRERRDELIARARPRAQQARHAVGGRGEHGQAVAPTSVHDELLELVEIVGGGDEIARRRGRGGQGRPVSRQCGEDVSDERVGPAANDRRIDAADRVRDGQMREMRQTLRCGRRARQRREGVGADDDRGHSEALEGHRVVDTPRRARPSIG
jgi:hypothetical protein